MTRGEQSNASTFLKEAGETWNTVVHAAPQWGLLLLGTGVLALLFTVVYRTLHALTRRLGRRFPHWLAWFTQADVILRITVFTAFLVTAASLYPTLEPLGGPLLRVYLVVLLVYVGWEVIQYGVRYAVQRFALDASLRLLITNVTRVVWAALGLYLVFQQFNINLLPILGGLGIVGVAFGFAAQDLLSNLIAGVTLLLDRPFTLGDWIRTGEWEGQVQRLTLRTTRLRTRDNEYISIPNSKIAGNDVVNLSAGGPLRVRSSVSIAYAAEIDVARQALMPILEHEPLILHEPPPRVAVVELGDSGVNLDLIYWIAQETIGRRPQVQQRVLEAAKQALGEAGVEIPFPQLQVHLRERIRISPSDTGE